jgi:hypothetical protein
MNCLRRDEGFDFGLLLGIVEVAIRAEGLKSRRDGDMIGLHGYSVPFLAS